MEHSRAFSGRSGFARANKISEVEIVEFAQAFVTLKLLHLLLHPFILTK